MRHVICVLVLLTCHVAYAQDYKVGDRVVAISRQALKVPKGEVDEVFPGLSLRVGAINGKWLWVGQGKPGWLDKKYVVPFDRAIDYFTDKVVKEPSNTTWRYARALIWKNKGELDIAIRDYTELIRINPKDSAYYNARAHAWHAKGEYDKAIDDYNEAIRLDPKNATAYNNRGNAWDDKGEYDKAINDHNEAIRLDPKYAFAYSNRGNAWQAKGEYDKAINDHNEAIRLDPGNAAVYNNRAWLLATCPDANYRDGKKALEDAKRACDLTKYENAYIVGTLAAAYAETGDFPNAIKWQDKAHKMYSDEVKERWAFLLELYKQGKPYREEPKGK